MWAEGESDEAEDGQGAETNFRRPEFDVLRNEITHRDLIIRRADLSAYPSWFSSSSSA